jgi:formylmethanofuran dehydrogenase subunit D
MDNDKEKFIFTAEDIFQEIPGDPDNVMLKFPDEVLALTGWKEGDTLDIKLEDGKIVIKKNG